LNLYEKYQGRILILLIKLLDLGNEIEKSEEI